MSSDFIKKILQSLTSTLLVKIVGFIREILILRFFGITAFVSSILALNFFPSIISTFLRYYIPNISLGLIGDGNGDEKKSFENAVEFVKYFYFILIALVLFKLDLWSKDFIISYVIYVVSSFFIVIAGVEEFRGISKGKNIQVSFAALSSNLICIIFLLFFKNIFSYFILPLTILLQSFLNYILLKYTFDTISFKSYFELSHKFNYKKNIQLIGLITFIELIGMIYNLVDYTYIVNFSDNIKLYQINTYALMFYNLPISIIGFTLSTLLVDKNRMNKFILIIKKSISSYLFLILLSFIFLSLIFKGENIVLKIFLDLFAGKSTEKNSLLKIMSIYIPGIIPAIIVVVVSKVYLLTNKTTLLFKTYLIGLALKLVFSVLFVKFGFSDYLCISFSTTLAWLTVSLILIYQIKLLKIQNIIN